jgi:hypothetical protein
LILTRLAKSFRDHDWFTGFVELLLLVIGIFFGFQLDRWNEGRLDQQQANEYRQQLIVDLEVEARDVDEKAAYHRQVRDFSMMALTAWSDEPAGDTDELIVAFYQASNVLPLTSARGAYDALSNNGLIDLVGGPGLTSRLAGFYGQEFNSIFSEEKAYRMELRGVMPIAVQEKIRTDCISISVGAMVVEVLNTDCDLNLSPDEASEILEDLLAHPEMRFYLRQAISRDSISIYLLGSKREFIESLLSELRELEPPGKQT